MRFGDRANIGKRLLDEVKSLDREKAIEEGRYSRSQDLTGLVIKADQREMARVMAQADLNDSLNGQEMSHSRPGRLQMVTKFEIRKFEDDVAYQENRPYEVNKFEKNLGLNGGIGEALDLICGLGGTAYSNANSRTGVGIATTAEVNTQSGLLGGTTTTASMDATYPNRSAQTVSFRSTYTGALGNFAWNEFVIDNSTATDALIRKVSTQGTKTAGQTWELTIQITMS